MTRLSVCGLGVSCNEMIDTPMLLIVPSRCKHQDCLNAAPAILLSELVSHGPSCHMDHQALEIESCLIFF